MIRYALLCARDHGFEAWFRDSDGFERQSASGQVVCPHCGATEVRKAVMAPAVRRPAETRASPGAAAPAAPAPHAAPGGGPAKMRAALREMHAALKRDAVDVGPAFPEQARAIHEGEAAARAIYGTATDAEARALIEDGVAILPIPALPDDHN